MALKEQARDRHVSAALNNLPNAITKRQLLVFDLETTGLDVKTDRIVQFGIAGFSNSKEFGRGHDTLVNPCRAIPQEVSAIHGIYDEDVKDVDSFGTIGGSFEKTLSSPNGVLLAGYNAVNFDTPLLNAEFARHGFGFKVDADKVFDPLIWLKFSKRGLRSRKLSAVAEHYGIPFENAHRASSDAQITGRILFKLIEEKIIPDDVEEALNAQKRIVDVLFRENQMYGHFLYFDRENSESLRIGFGKHSGVLLSDAPVSYLRWILSLKDLPPLAISAIREYA